METGQDVIFDSKKHLEFKRILGKGGFGETYLFYDKLANTYFAIKKHVPKNDGNSDDAFTRFIDEIKLLFNMSHPNVVRVYSYYLYPEYNTGYIQMEYIDGVSLDNFSPNSTVNFDDIFLECVNAFAYLEEKKILHRDIRPANIMIDKSNHVKIIDFGFGKVEENPDSTTSLFLNWPVSDYPIEVVERQIYNESTEVYILGKVLKKCISNNSFSYSNILNKMCINDPELRYSSFSEVLQDINNDLFTKIAFSTENKQIYRNFVDKVIDSITEFHNRPPVFQKDINVTETMIADFIKKNALEDNIHNVPKLLFAFLEKGTSFSYNQNNNISINVVKNFYSFLMSLNEEQKKLVILNIQNRLNDIEVKPYFDDSDLPF